MTLPVIALSLATIATVTQQIRGLGTGIVVFQHVLRNAGGPALAVLAVQFIGLLGGAIVIEQVFALSGMGQLTIQATTLGDIPVDHPPHRGIY